MCEAQNATVDTGKGRIKVYDRFVRDPRRLGRIRLDEVLIYSSNVGTIKVASFLSREDVEDMLEAFHLKRRFGIFPGEANPLIPDFSYPANILYASHRSGYSDEHPQHSGRLRRTGHGLHTPAPHSQGDSLAYGRGDLQGEETCSEGQDTV
ncbi:MAG: hypothetical protein Q9N34_01985 [Aquificota bacterium]|nr:hypothetical protein [Aquificota bacterium]